MWVTLPVWVLVRMNARFCGFFLVLIQPAGGARMFYMKGAEGGFEGWLIRTVIFTNPIIICV